MKLCSSVRMEFASSRNGFVTRKTTAVTTPMNTTVAMEEAVKRKEITVQPIALTVAVTVDNVMTGNLFATETQIVQTVQMKQKAFVRLACGARDQYNVHRVSLNVQMVTNASITRWCATMKLTVQINLTKRIVFIVQMSPSLPVNHVPPIERANASQSRTSVTV